MAPHNNQLTMMDNILRGAIGKQEAMKRNIHENHSLSMASATRLQEVEDILVKMAKDGVIGEEEVRKFVDKQRKRLVEIAAKNVENERDVDSFVSAATQLRQQELLDLQQQQQQQQDGDAGVGGSGIATKDYDTILQDLYEKDRASRSAAERTADGGKYVREIRNELNEEVLDGGDGGAMDEDEDIVCMNNTLASQAQGNLKCPITGSLFERPVQNKVCGHKYSEEGIAQHMRQMRRNGRQCTCPVAGCTNIVAENQLEHDTYLETLVRRERRRIDHEAEQRMSQAAAVDESDEE